VAEAAKASHIAYGYAADKMLVIPNGLNFEAFDKASQHKIDFRAQAGWSADDLLIGCVGRYHPDKGQDLLLQAATLLKQRTASARFVMIGRGCDQNNPALVSLLSLGKLQHDVLLLGERDDIPACLAALDIFCLPSRTEGFPNVLAEAMTAALPAVATDVGDVALLAGHNMTLVPANNAEALAAQLQVMLNESETKRHAIGLENRQRVMDNFSIAAIRQRYDAFYQQLQEL
jgi:glycosyltransferase involved in cell wall biosynthesis